MPNYLEQLKAHTEARDLEAATAAARMLASDWHSGQASALYGFASTGDLEAWGRSLAELPTVQTAHLHGAELEAFRALAEFGELAARHGKCGPCVDLCESRYRVVDDGHGGSDVEYLNVDGRGLPEFYAQTLEFVTPDEFDAEEGHTPATLAVEAMRRHGLGGATLSLTGNGEGRTYGEPSTIDYREGIESEPVANLYGFSREELATIERML